MIFKRFFTTSLIALILLSLASIGCGKNETPHTEKKGLLQQIKSRGKVIVGTEAAFAPFEYVENGKIVGYGSDILNEIVKKMNVDLEQMDVPFSGILTGLETKKFDFIATAVSATPDRREKFAMTTPIADATVVFIKRKGDSSIKNWPEDMNGKKIGVMVGAPFIKNLEKYNDEFKKQGKEGIKEIVQYKSKPEANLDLKNDRLDLVLQIMPVANYLIKNDPDSYEIVGKLDEVRYMTWVVRKEDKDLLEFINKEIIAMKKSGKLAELQQKWFGTTWDLPDQLP